MTRPIGNTRSKLLGIFLLWFLIGAGGLGTVLTAYKLILNTVQCGAPTVFPGDDSCGAQMSPEAVELPDG